MIWIRYASLLMLLAVALGAFGAHALRSTLSESSRQIYHTAVLYHMIHALGLFAVGWLATLKPSEPLVRTAGWAHVIGILLFSGSLYLLSVTGVKKLGMITPIGGVSFIVGWACLAMAAK